MTYFARISQSALLHTSSAEGAPTVIREARALGVPVVACAAGDVASWAESDDGIFVSPADVESLAGALRHACRAGAGTPDPQAERERT